MSINSILTTYLGKVLVKVEYYCIQGEYTSVEETSDPLFFFGGTVHLTFDSVTKPLNISWKQDEKDFILEIENTTIVPIPSYHQAYEVTNNSPWENCKGKALSDTEIYGWGLKPQVALLKFEDSYIYIGTGYREHFGNGDDIIVRSKNTVDKYNLLNGAKPLVIH